jgi:transcriptional regulator with XRE-family HTH domain
MSKTKDRSIGGLIKHYRILKDLTQEELAEMLNLSYQQVQKYEYNKVIPPHDKLGQLSKVLEIPIELFFNEGLRGNLIDKIEGEIAKNYELLKLIKENPELLELVRSYSKNKTNIKAIDFLKFLKDLLNIPKDKKDSYLNLINKIALLIT